MLDLNEIGHGWVVKKPNGVKCHCGGIAICTHCQLEKEVLRLKKESDSLRNLVHSYQLRAAQIRGESNDE